MSDDTVICVSYPGAGALTIGRLTQKILSGDSDNSKAAENATVEPPCEAGRNVIISQQPCDQLPTNAKVIYVYRDPRDIAVSQWRNNCASSASAAQPARSEFIDKFLTHGGAAGLWSEHFRSCQEARKKRQDILVLYYESVREDADATIRQLVGFLNKKLTEEDVAGLVALCKTSVAETDCLGDCGATTGWKTMLTVSESDQFDKNLYDERKRLKLDMPYWPYSKMAVEVPPFINCYEYQGIQFFSRPMPFERVRSIYDYADIRDDDVFVWTYPKAGTHWVTSIASKLPCKPDLTRTREFELDFTSLEIRPLAGGPVDPKMVPQSLEELSEMRSPRIIATHLPFRMLPKLVQQGKAKLIYVYRDPRDMAVSMFHMHNRYLKDHPQWNWSSFIDSFIEGKVPLGPWWEHFYSCQQHADKPNILVLHYEKMKQDLKEAVKKIDSFLCRQASDAVIDEIARSCSFEEAKKAKPNSMFMRKGVAGGWKSSFTVLESERFDRKLEEVKAEYALDIPY